MKVYVEGKDNPSKDLADKEKNTTRFGKKIAF